MRRMRLNRLDTAALWISGAIFLAFALGTAVLARGGGAVIDPMAGQIGDLLMQEGVRLEFAEMFPEAVAAYKKAVSAEFDSRENRLHALRRLGLLTLKIEGPAAAAGYLAESAAGKGAPLASYQALCNVLLALGRYDEAVDAAGRWAETAEGAKARPDQAALAWLALGKAYQGRKAEDDALAAFEKGRLTDPSSQNAYEAAAIYYEQGKFKEAANVLESFLNDSATGGAPASRVEAARGLYERVKRELGARQQG